MIHIYNAQLILIKLKSPQSLKLSQNLGRQPAWMHCAHQDCQLDTTVTKNICIHPGLSSCSHNRDQKCLIRKILAENANHSLTAVVLNKKKKTKRKRHVLLLLKNSFRTNKEKHRLPPDTGNILPPALGFLLPLKHLWLMPKSEG